MFCNIVKSQSFWALPCIGIPNGLTKVNLYVAIAISFLASNIYFLLMQAFIEIREIYVYGGIK
jgi:hypothetical protein